ncbi:MAG TPA: glutamate-cysteine ligase family protein [Thermoanaerobaculia bacterium]|nr:glutamate-cysteine ligase family protein [Thermoanaerobaculia bacterium]
MTADNDDRRPLHLFEATGIELEYMIVDARTLAVRPIADRLLAVAGSGDGSDVERGAAAWSNELALHVVEIKTNGPVARLGGVGELMQSQIREIGGLLEPLGARLMPTAMHPFMDPHSELRLWPHENDVVYRTFDRIFDCRGHGWANLQSVHVNLPFAGDDEFGRLHAAIRVVLPILPALAASSPAADGRLTGLADTRMSVYAGNAARVPSVAGAVVPEPIFTQREYEDVLLGGIYRDLAPLDPEGVLRHEWVNARGCIARFDRGAIEIRVLDVQECPAADLAIAGASIGAVRALVEERHVSARELRGWSVPALAAILRDAVAAGDEAVLRDDDYLRLFGFPGRAPCRARDLWQHLIESEARREPAFTEWEPPLALYVTEGCLARRITGALGGKPSKDDFDRVYRMLCDCLHEGRLFIGA